MPSSSFPKAILAPIPAFPQESSDRLLGASDETIVGELADFEAAVGDLEALRPRRPAEPSIGAPVQRSGRVPVASG